MQIYIIGFLTYEQHYKLFMLKMSSCFRGLKEPKNL